MDSEMKIWKINQRIYKGLVEKHEDARDELTLRISPIKAEDAVAYFLDKKPVVKYPIKSYLVAIVYAKLLEKEFGEPFYETLNDADLFMGEDGFFKTYDQDKKNYDMILEAIKDIEDIEHKGLGAETARYWWLECTSEGIDHLMKKAYPRVKG